jgi:hypothetical protein
MRRAGFVTVLIVVAGTWIGAAPPAWAMQADSVVEQAANALRTDSVYVDPSAEAALDPEETDQLRDRISQSEAGAIYVAVLPDRAGEEAGGSAGQVLEELRGAVGRDGTYAVVVGTELRATSTEIDPGTVASVANEAVAKNQGNGAAPVLFGFVDLLEDAAQGGSGTGDGDGSTFGLLPIVLAGFVLIAVFSSLRRRRERRLLEQREKEQLEEVRELALEDLVALGDDLRTLDLDVEMPNAAPGAKDDYVTALGCYERATKDLDRARRPQELASVTSALEEGRHAIACTRARLDGREPPARRPPCFFDPRHGPSARDVEWGPPGGALRPVPACAEDARRIDQGMEPLARQIIVEGRPVPYWDAPYYYGPWAGGYFGGSAGGFFEGMLLGSVLSGGWGYGGWGGGYGDDGGGGDLGGGDFGGGDFGGGDFGGGDFGGGDFGGSDFGGGDFG